jgi:hypothetical protein
LRHALCNGIPDGGKMCTNCPGSTRRLQNQHFVELLSILSTCVQRHTNVIPGPTELFGPERLRGQCELPTLADERPGLTRDEIVEERGVGDKSDDLARVDVHRYQPYSVARRRRYWTLGGLASWVVTRMPSRARWGFIRFGSESPRPCKDSTHRVAIWLPLRGLIMGFSAGFCSVSGGNEPAVEARKSRGKLVVAPTGNARRWTSAASLW